MLGLFNLSLVELLILGAVGLRSCWSSSSWC